MDCRLFEKKMSLYIDDELNNIEEKEFELHMLECSKCRKKYENMIYMLKAVKSEPQTELPDDYRAKLREKLNETSKEKRRFRNWKKFSSIAAVFLVLIVSYRLISDNLQLNEQEGNYETVRDFKGDSEEKDDITALDNPSIMAKENTMDGYGIDPDTSTEDSTLDEEAASEDNSESRITPFSVEQLPRSASDNNKYVKEAYIDLEINNFDEIFELISEFVTDKAGYIENFQRNTNESTESEKETVKGVGHIRIKVSEGEFLETIDFLRELGIVKSEKIVQDDISDSYYDLENSIKNLQAQENQLKELLNNTDSTSDKVLIEDELRKIRTEIDNHIRGLNTLDESIKLSIINTNVVEPTDSTKKQN